MGDPAVDHHRHKVWLNMVEQPLVVGDHQHAHLGLLRVERVDAVGDDLERVDVEPRVGLVHHRHVRLEHRHLQDLDPLLLAAAEALVEVAAHKGLVDFERGHLLAQLLAELGHRDGGRLGILAILAAMRIDRRAQEVRHRHAGDGDRVLEGQEQPQLGALIGPQLKDVLALVPDLAARHRVAGVAH